MFKPIIVGGQDISSLRAVFDHDDKRIIVPSNRQILYYNIQSGHQDAVSNISPKKLQPNEIITGCDRFGTSLYLFTNYGQIFIWNLELRDWINDLSLPIDEEKEVLKSCKLVSKRQFVFTVREKGKNDRIYHTISRSERERPKNSELISNITGGLETSFDIGCCIDERELTKVNKSTKDKISKGRVLAFIHKNNLFLQRLGVGEKFDLNLERKTIDLDLTCVRANPRLPMVATGDKLGRIYLYSGGFKEKDSWNDRTKLHWHRNAVTDLCFSNTGHTLYSIGGESGCVVIWDLAANSIGQKHVIAGLGMPIRHLNYSPNLGCVVLSSEDNEIQFMDTDNHLVPMKTLTRRTYDIYLENNFKAMRFDSGRSKHALDKSVGFLWHAKTDSLVTNCKTGKLQFYSIKQRATTEVLDCLKTSILSLEKDGRVLPSEITRAALSLDGDWLALYETRESIDGFFPEVKLHIWQRSNTFSKWFWIQTADRLHSSANIADLKFSPDGKYLVSVGEDGTFHVLHRISLDTKSAGKQMYAKGFFSNVPGGLPSLAAFSQDSSVLAISLKNESTLIWMIVDPYKLEYECQLNRDDSEDIEQLPVAEDENRPSRSSNLKSVLGLHFGRHEPSRSIAPLCEVRSNYIRIWNILNAQSSSTEMMEYLATDGCKAMSSGIDPKDGDATDIFTSAAFDQSAGSNQVLEHFAVSTKRNLIHLFELKINQESSKLQPLMIFDGSLTQINNMYNPRYFAHMCFVGNPILDIDTSSHEDPLVVKLINRLCVVTNEQELVGFTDKLTVERELAINSCNTVEAYELGDIQQYFAKSRLEYQNNIQDSPRKAAERKSVATTTKQRRIKKKLEVQRMIKDMFERIPSHNLPRMDILGRMILDKLIIE